MPWFPARTTSLGEAFWQALTGRPRFVERAVCNLELGMSFDEAMMICKRRVASEIQGGGVPFYLGITEDPQRRFAEHCSGGGQAWERMLVLLQASASATTASAERMLISEFGDRLQCLNDSGGGEGASSGSPHFCYVLLGSGPIRRSRHHGMVGI